MASDEVAERERAVWLGAVCWASGLLLAGGTRLRVGADAAGAGPGGWRAGVEPAGLGKADGEDSAGAAPARGQPVAQKFTPWVRGVWSSCSHPPHSAPHLSLIT